MVVARVMVKGSEKMARVASDQELEGWFRLFYPRVYSYVLARTGDQDVAQDLTAEAFARAWESWGQLEHQEARASWLWAIARNLVASHFRQSYRRAKGEDRLGTILEPPMDDPEEAVLASDDKRSLQEALAGLSEREQEVLRLRFEADLDSRQVGDLLGLSDVHVRVILHRALGKLRRAMTGMAAA
jgi:RNA polymerase sigma-70 factor (ECF subfamily)